MTNQATPAEALGKLLEQQRSQRAPLSPLGPRQLGVYSAADYAPLAQPDAVTAFQELARTLEPVERALFAYSISKRIPRDAALQLTLGLTFADVAERQKWQGAYMLLNAVHLNTPPQQPMHQVVVQQLHKLHARSEDENRDAVAHMLKTMPGGPY